MIETDFPPEDKFDHLPDSATPQGVTAFLTIQEGCDKFCSFCVVPYTRGAEQSRSAETILREARHLVAQGAREITLLGQNVNAWHDGPNGTSWGLGRLLREMADIPGLLRLRYATSHPRDMDDDLIAAHRDVTMLMPFLHLPIQSGSDRILAAMNRKHTADDYRRVVDRLRAARPDIALSSDFIVGHPGETEADFEATLALVRDVGFAQAYSFKYSARPGTPAAGAPAQVPEHDKDRRLQVLQGLLRDQQARFNAGCVGLELPVLFTGPGRHPGQIAGRSPFLQPVHLSGSANLIGTESMVRIVADHPNSLAGTLVQETNSLTHITSPLAAPQPSSAAASGKTMASSAQSGGKAITLQFNDNTLLPPAAGGSRPASGADRAGAGGAAVVSRQSDRHRGGRLAGGRRAGDAAGAVAAIGAR